MTIVYTKNEAINLNWIESTLKKSIYNTIYKKHAGTGRVVEVLRKSVISRYSAHINLRYLSLKRL